MTDFTTIQERAGRYYGYDADTKRWQEVPAELVEGGALGSLGRAATRALDDITIGAGQLAQPENARLDEMAATLQAEREINYAVNPTSQTIGNLAPEAVLGLATAPYSLPAAIGAEMLIGGARTADDGIERVQNMATAGAATLLGPAASAGMRLASDVVGQIMGSAQRSVQAGVEAANVINLDDAIAAQAGRQGGRSTVGAQQVDDVTTDSTFDQILDRGTEYDEAIVAPKTPDNYKEMNRRMEAVDSDYEKPLFAASAPNSIQRKIAAAAESQPLLNPYFNAVKDSNDAAITKLASRAMGMGDRDTLDRADIFYRMEEIGDEIAGRVAAKIRPIDKAGFYRSLEQLKTEFKSAAPGDEGFNYVADMKEKLGRFPGLTLSPETLLRTRSDVLAKMREAKSVSEMETMQKVIQKIDDAIETHASNDSVAASYRQMREQYRLAVTMSKAAISKTGATTGANILNRLAKEYGSRTKMPKPVRDMYDVLAFHLKYGQTNVNDSGTATRMMLQQLGGGAAIGLGGAGGAIGIWNAL